MAVTIKNPEGFVVIVEREAEISLVVFPHEELPYKARRIPLEFPSSEIPAVFAGTVAEEAEKASREWEAVAAGRMSPKKGIARKIGVLFGMNGTRWVTEKGESLECVCRSMGAVSETRGDVTRHLFPDGSAILVYRDGWELEGSLPWLSVGGQWLDSVYYEHLRKYASTRAAQEIVIDGPRGPKCIFLSLEDKPVMGVEGKGETTLDVDPALEKRQYDACVWAAFYKMVAREAKRAADDHQGMGYSGNAHENVI